MGETLDDAAGEAFDKTAKLMGLGYPGGPAVARTAQSGNPQLYEFPRPMTDRPGLDFSFSGLKTHTRNLWQANSQKPNAREDIAAGFRFRGGTRVVYRSDQDPTAALELFSVPTNGSQVSRKHSAPLVPNGNVLSFQLSADGTKVAYLADQDGDEVVELFLSDLGGLVRTVPFGAPPRPADRQF